MCGGCARSGAPVDVAVGQGSGLTTPFAGSGGLCAHSQSLVCLIELGNPHTPLLTAPRSRYAPTSLMASSQSHIVAGSPSFF